MADIPIIVNATWLRDHNGQNNIKILDASSHLPTAGRIKPNLPQNASPGQADATLT